MTIECHLGLEYEFEHQVIQEGKVCWHCQQHKTRLTHKCRMEDNLNCKTLTKTCTTIENKITRQRMKKPKTYKFWNQTRSLQCCMHWIFGSSLTKATRTCFKQSWEANENLRRLMHDLFLVVEDITHELHNDEMLEPQENFNKWPSSNTSMNSFNNWIYSTMEAL